MDTLYVNNDHVIEIQGLRDVSGGLISGATAQATLYEADGLTEVEGLTWPLALSYVGHRGTYRAELPSAIKIVNKGRYRLKLSAVFVGRRYEVTRNVIAEVRYE